MLCNVRRVQIVVVKIISYFHSDRLIIDIQHMDALIDPCSNFSERFNALRNRVCCSACLPSSECFSLITPLLRCDFNDFLIFFRSGIFLFNDDQFRWHTNVWVCVYFNDSNLSFNETFFFEKRNWQLITVKRFYNSNWLAWFAWSVFSRLSSTNSKLQLTYRSTMFYEWNAHLIISFLHLLRHLPNEVVSSVVTVLVR